uniref:Uncharacterized protein n=1 Tax=Xiphophorus couchianus TaxID=32473 RepID=A0A3B5L5Q9_9TELE
MKRKKKKKKKFRRLKIQTTKEQKNIFFFCLVIPFTFFPCYKLIYLSIDLEHFHQY